MLPPQIGDDETNTKTISFFLPLQMELASQPLELLLEEKRRRGDKIIDLTESNPTAVGLGYPKRNFTGARREALHYEPNPRGLLTARQAVAEYYQQRGKMSIRSAFISPSAPAKLYVSQAAHRQQQNVLVRSRAIRCLNFWPLGGVDLAPYQLAHDSAKRGGN
jgi:hypothetical protein